MLGFLNMLPYTEASASQAQPSSLPVWARRPQWTMEQSGHEAKQPEQLINQIEPQINH